MKHRPVSLRQLSLLSTLAAWNAQCTVLARKLLA